MAILVKIQEHQLQNCIGYLSSKDSPSNFPQSNSCGVFHCSGIESCSSGRCFALQVYGNRPPFYYLHLNRIFIERQGFKVGDQIILEPVKNVETCQWLELVPETYNDWNIIENTSCIIEEIFLQQIRVLQPGMSFVLHLSPGVVVNLRVAKLMPKIPDGSAVLANNSTQVLVAPINNPSTKHNKENMDNSSSTTQNENIGLQDPISALLNTKTKSRSRFLRVLPKLLLKIEDFQIPNSTIVTISQDDNLYVKAELVRVEGSDLKESQFATLILLPKNGNGLKDGWLQLFKILEKESINTCCPSEDLRTMGLNCYTHLKCQTLKRKHVRKISTLNYSASIDTSPEIVRKSLKEFCQNPLIYSPFLLTSNGAVLKLSYGSESTKNYYFAKFTSDELQNQSNYCGYFWPDSIQQLKLKEDTTPLKLRSEGENKKPILTNYGQQSSTTISSFDFQLDLCQKFVDSLCVRLKLASNGVLPTGHLLITGPSFSGKSILTQLIANNLFDKMRVFTLYIDCNEFKGKSPDIIANSIDIKLKALKIRQPSVLLLDNLDFLNTQVEDEDRRRFISKVYSKMAHSITKSHIQLIATAVSKSSLSSDLLNFNGHQFFTDILEVPPMKKEDYVQVFDKQLNLNISKANELLRRIERLNLGETLKLCNRLKLTHSNEIRVENALGAIDNLPSSSRTQKPTTNEQSTSFKDIGGYEKIKQQLREVFLWPMLYPQIYKSVGIRIGNGAILHGPSGCGKTLIARGLATETGLNVIHVKGPELLSKYIGASEENVRKVFERARQSKPSLIIFDEFDSLVPKRGHDNTGVTDRVVNQFLTELDGVDSSMDGIFVLAATNRMDLIDAALLRPGRFDHKVFVGQPDKDDRLEILRLQCKDVCLEDENDLNVLADLTENWSGAELRGLIVNALFESTRNAHENDEKPTITQQALKNSFRSTLESKKRPTISGKSIKGSRVSLA